MGFSKRVTLFQTPRHGGARLLPFSDNFDRADGALGNDWEFSAGCWTIETNRAACVPGLGEELVTNGDFAAWTGDNPDGWTINGEAAGYYITEAAGGGAARMVSDGTTITLAQQVILGAGKWIRRVFDLVAMPDANLMNIFGSIVGAGTVHNNIVAHIVGAGILNTANPTLTFQNSGAVDLTIDNVSAKEITFKDTIATREFGEDEVTLTAVIVKSGLYTDSNQADFPKAGLVFNLDSQDTPQNCVVVYIDHLAMRAHKCVNGTWTTIAQINITYGATKVLKVIKLGNTYLFFYGDTGSEAYIGLAQVTDESVIHNTRHGLFLATEYTWLNSFTAAKASKPAGFRIGGLGDSIMADSNSYYIRVSSGYATATGLQAYLMQHAAGGATIVTNMDTQTAAAVHDLADILIVNLGTNDNNGGNMVTLQAEVEENLAELKAGNPGCAIYYLNVLPRWTDSGGGTVVDKSNIRAAIAAACTAQGVTCWDPFTDPWITADQTTDGCHLTAAGHQAVADRILALLT